MSGAAPSRAGWGASTRALHDAIDAHIRASGVAHLHPSRPTVQRDLLGGAEMIAWQDAKGAFLWGAEGCWSELPHVYARYGTDGTRALLARLRGLYGAPGALVTDCGMQAIALLADAVLGPGAHVVMTRQVYNKTRTLLRWQTERLGGRLTEVEDGDLDALAAAIEPSTRLVFVESFTNPLGRVQDVPALAAVVAAARARAPGLRLAVDDTLLTPFGPRQSLLELGADVVVGAGTKALGGEDAALWGYLVARDSGLLNQVMDLQAMRGGVMDGERAGEVAAGLDEARARWSRRCASAAAIASFLHAQPAVEAVWHPSLPGHPDADAIARDVVAHGSLVAFRWAGADDDAHRHLADVLAMTEVWRYALSFDGLCSKVNHHTTVSEYHTPPPVRRKLGLDRLIRLGVGVEDTADLIAALAWAMQAAPRVSADAVADWQRRRRAELGLPG